MAAMQWDAVVVGLGAMGSATLWRLAERGVRALGVDRFAPPHDRGSSHGDSRIIRSAYFEDPAYVPLVADAFTLWRGLEAQASEPLLAMSGAAMIGPAGGELVGGSLRAAREHGLAHALLDTVEAAARMPQHVLSAGDVVLHEDAAGVLRPELCVAAMLRRATELGAAVRTSCRVQRIESRGEAVRVHLGDGDEPVDAQHVVVCAGPWLPRLLPDLPCRCASSAR
jgi:sarcosine oxidase